MVVLNKRSKGGKGVESVDDEELYNGIMDEISSGDIQSTMDKLLENQSFDFGDFVGKTINSGKGIDFNNILKQIADGIVSNLNDEKSLYTNIILIALSGAVITNFSKLLQGKRVAQMGFYTIYVLFFSVSLEEPVLLEKLSAALSCPRLSSPSESPSNIIISSFSS